MKSVLKQWIMIFSIQLSSPSVISYQRPKLKQAGETAWLLLEMYISICTLKNSKCFIKNSKSYDPAYYCLVDTAKGIKVRLHYAYLYTGSYTPPPSTQLQNQPKCPSIEKLKNFKCGIHKM